MEKSDKHKESDPILLAGQANENNDSFWSQSTIQELNTTALVSPAASLQIQWERQSTVREQAKDSQTLQSLCSLFPSCKFD